ncbi:MAG: NAD(P)H-hydrate dehydratase [Opitutaceae bacterium]|nr:NAD(P)H-hydrate dehydratase [Opitutaceae bacterium]
MAGTVPILSVEAARALEEARFGGDEAREWPAMVQAGQAIAREVERDAGEIGGLPADARFLVLAGKGHNGGDALLAAAGLLARCPGARADVVLAFGERSLRPLAARAWRDLVQAAAGRVQVTSEFRPAGYDLCLDGLFGFQFRPPVEPPIADLIARVNALPVRLRAAVDLPSAGLFRADFTYATGSVKAPVVAAPEAGRVRYLDLGFFRGDEPGAERVLTRAVLAPLAGLRPVQSDKRSYGHVFIVGGSRSYPGAILMSVLAALHSGAGLVTAFVPESLVAAFAARAPEAMWVGWPETPAGGLALEGEHLLRTRLERASALVLGPGLGREPETLALARSVVEAATVPLVIDADALQPDIVTAGNAARILTPHAGEFARLAGGRALRDCAAEVRATVVLKGAVTQVATPDRVVYHSFFGGPLLARGGSGDLLAGLTGGLLAQTPGDPALAAARGVVWHGRAADLAARVRGQASIRVTQLLDFLPAALREH